MCELKYYPEEHIEDDLEYKRGCVVNAPYAKLQVLQILNYFPVWKLFLTFSHFQYQNIPNSFFLSPVILHIHAIRHCRVFCTLEPMVPLSS